MAEHTKNVLSDVFVSFKDLAAAATTTDGQQVIRGYLDGPTQAEDVISFWLNEYIAE